VLAQVLTNSSSAFTDPDDWVRRNTELVKRTADQVLADGVESLRDSWINPSRSARIPEPTRATMAAEFAEHDRQGVAGSLTITNRYLALGERVLDVSHPTLLTVGVLEERFLRLMPQARRIPGIEVAEVDAAHAVNAQNGPQWNEAAVAFLDRHGGPGTA
jgi:hypothetical protein